MPPKPAPKRKSDAQDIDTAVGPSIAKKPRTLATHSDPAAASTAKLVDDILTNVAEWTLPKELEVKEIVVYLATYARLLELDLEIERAQKAQAGGASGPAEKDVNLKKREELESAAEKIRRSTASGICKQMTVRTHAFDYYVFLPSAKHEFDAYNQRLLVETDMRDRTSKV